MKNRAKIYKEKENKKIHTRIHMPRERKKEQEIENTYYDE